MEKILIVDSETYQRKIQRVLGNDGFEYVCCTSGKAAIAEFREIGASYDLVIAAENIQEGTLTGLRVAEIMREENRDQKVIIIGGGSCDHMIAFRMGIPALRKPFKDSRLKSLVESVLES